jgi:hypothetical protein
MPIRWLLLGGYPLGALVRGPPPADVEPDRKSCPPSWMGSLSALSNASQLVMPGTNAWQPLCPAPLAQRVFVLHRDAGFGDFLGYPRIHLDAQSNSGCTWLDQKTRRVSCIGWPCWSALRVAVDARSRIICPQRTSSTTALSSDSGLGSRSSAKVQAATPAEDRGRVVSGNNRAAVPLGPSRDPKSHALPLGLPRW